MKNRTLLTIESGQKNNHFLYDFLKEEDFFLIQTSSSKEFFKYLDDKTQVIDLIVLD
jgi:hypothetical protein